MCSSIIRRGDGSKPLLTSSIPNLQFDRFAVELKCADLEINTDCADVALRISVISKTQQQARLSDTGITDEKQFEKVIAVINKPKVKGSVLA